MAVNCSVSPLATDGFTGVTAIEVSAAAVTVRVSPVTRHSSSAAVMVDEPVASVEARPLVEMVATAGFADAQVTWLVRLRSCRRCRSPSR